MVRILVKKINAHLDTALEILTIGFIFAVTLVPKFPLISANLPVPIRLDDFFIVPLLILAMIVVIRNKELRRVLGNNLTKFILLWLITMLVSTIIGYVSHSVTDLKVSLFFLLRYIQYTSILFVGIVVLRDSTRIARFFYYILFLIIPIGLYALGQRLGLVGGWGGAFYGYQWVPVTDRAFATFAGPYELAAFVVLLAPIIVTLLVLVKSIRERVFLAVTYLFSALIMAFAAARTPPVAVFMGSLVAIPFLSGLKKKAAVLVLATILLGVPFLLSGTLIDRSKQFIETAQSFGRSLVYSPKNSTNTPTSTTQPTPTPPPTTASPASSTPANNYPTPTPARNAPTPSPAPVASKASPNPSPTPLATNTSATPSSTANTPPKSGMVSGLVASVLNEKSTTAPTSTTNVVNVEPSLKWRIDNLWPQAFNNFKKNPITGGGLYSAGVSLDSTFVTLLGETGLLGLVVFGLVIFEIVRMQLKNIRTSTGVNRAIFIGILCGVVALLINAVFIDVLRASKIAYLFWLIIGISAKYYIMYKRVYG